MAMIKITVLIAVVGCFTALAGWLAGRDKKIANDSQWRGSVDAKLDAIIGIKEEVKRLDEKIDKHGERISNVERDVKSAHRRLDEHIVKEK